MFPKGLMSGVCHPSVTLHSMVSMWSVKTVPKVETSGLIFGLEDNWMTRSAAYCIATVI